ncbi:hypothetical protein IQ16_08237 [Bradyrhizobium huanghuaihaiense]|uniref:Uncharacterized protein n=1 Tax=Bradyrhizobium huanghuaihaiense TaxID=990078 RepID=A0A562QQ58_9BRAD|nr:hypothetical protein IQ16_08237 [Bradyrhizobium huanghuaihaiense]
MTGRLDSPFAPPHIAHDADVECLQQRPRRFQPTSCIMVASSDHHSHARIRAAQPHERIVEELLRFPRGVLAVKHVASDDEGIDIPLHNDLFEPLKHLAVLVLPREPA